MNSATKHLGSASNKLVNMFKPSLLKCRELKAVVSTSRVAVRIK